MKIIGDAIVSKSGVEIQEIEDDSEEVELFLAHRLYQSLISSSVRDIPRGDWVMVHPTNGIVCHGSEEALCARDEYDEYMFQHKPRREHLHVCKIAHGQ